MYDADIIEWFTALNGNKIPIRQMKGQSLEEEKAEATTLKSGV